MSSAFSLGSALRDLGSAAGRLKAAAALQNAVYGTCEPSHVSSWRPRPYADNKSRYLWTDAFGVVNFISLAAEARDCTYLQQADALIADVHNTLGRTRDGRRRLGAATPKEPTRGGLRIGKAHDEGHPDGDGQYFHYLTKWAFALNRMTLATGEPRYNRWAVQLMEAVHQRFVHGGEPRMWWKVSVDLSRPLDSLPDHSLFAPASLQVGSEGNLDPFDGLVTYTLLREAAGDPSTLSSEIRDMERMVDRKYRRYASDDPLDLGEALWLAHWQLPGAPWAALVSERSLQVLEELWRGGYFWQRQERRLAFREFGTTLGVQVNGMAGPEWAPRTDELHSFWAGHLFTRDADITPVMFAASLLVGAWDKGYDSRLHRLQSQWRQRVQEE